LNKRIKILETIATDMENDAREFDGKPFNGKTVATYLGNLGAAVAALADIVRSIVEQQEEVTREKI
jgi:hypothetical protein